MGRFIEQHGLVQYRPRLNYPRDGSCEITGCSTLRVGFSGKKGNISGWTVSQREDSPLYFDHCHAHGWIRGLVCASCNSVMRHLDKYGYLKRYRVDLREVYRKHVNQCPDCEQINMLPTDYEINYAYTLTLPDCGFKSVIIRDYSKSMQAVAKEHGMALDEFATLIRARHPEPRIIAGVRGNHDPIVGRGDVEYPQQFYRARSEGHRPT